MQRKIVSLIAVVTILVLTLNIIRDVRGFVRKNIAKFETENFSYYNISKNIPYNLILIGKNIVTEYSGDVEYLKSNFDYVSKDEIVAKIISTDLIGGLYAPISGIFLKGFVSYEFENATDIFNSDVKFKFNDIEKSSFSKNEPIGCVVLPNEFYIRVNKNDYSQDKITFLINDFVKVSGTKVFESETFSYYKFDKYLESFLKNGKALKVFEKSVYGLKVPKESIISSYNKNYIFIVNGNVIKKVEIQIEQIEYNYAIITLKDSNFTNFSSLIVVLTPRIFKEGEIVGNF